MNADLLQQVLPVVCQQLLGRGQEEVHLITRLDALTRVLPCQTNPNI